MLHGFDLKEVFLRVIGLIVHLQSLFYFDTKNGIITLDLYGKLFYIYPSQKANLVSSFLRKYIIFINKI